MSRWFGDGLPPRFPAYSTRRFRPCPSQQRFIDKGVIDDHIGLLQRVQRMKGDEARVTGAATGHPDPSRLEHRPVAPVQLRQVPLRKRLRIVGACSSWREVVR